MTPSAVAVKRCAIGEIYKSCNRQQKILFYSILGFYDGLKLAKSYREVHYVS